MDVIDALRILWNERSMLPSLVKQLTDVMSDRDESMQKASRHYNTVFASITQDQNSTNARVRLISQSIDNLSQKIDACTKQIIKMRQYNEEEFNESSNKVNKLEKTLEHIQEEINRLTLTKDSTSNSSMLSDDHMQVIERNTRNITSLLNDLQTIKTLCHENQSRIDSLQREMESIRKAVVEEDNVLNTVETLNVKVESMEKAQEQTMQAVDEITSRMQFETSGPATRRREAVDETEIEQVKEEIKDVKETVQELRMTIRKKQQPVVPTSSTGETSYVNVDQLRHVIDEMQAMRSEHAILKTTLDRYIESQRDLSKDVMLLTNITENIMEDITEEKQETEPNTTQIDPIDGIFPCITSRLDAVGRVVRDFRSRCVPSAI